MSNQLLIDINEEQYLYIGDDLVRLSDLQKVIEHAPIKKKTYCPAWFRKDIIHSYNSLQNKSAACCGYGYKLLPDGRCIHYGVYHHHQSYGFAFGTRHNYWDSKFYLDKSLNFSILLWAKKQLLDIVEQLPQGSTMSIVGRKQIKKVYSRLSRYGFIEQPSKSKDECRFIKEV